ncbi:hypothetical protein B1J92_I08437g [Nakaseomyces glabratus]|nr:hypothetical protein B1J91_I08437g [Nakaseomyces glabratus]OXB47857.1 hypothetical protein B1J92_I08437g [Nakaseomyces glabratus]
MTNSTSEDDLNRLNSLLTHRWIDFNSKSTQINGYYEDSCHAGLHKVDKPPLRPLYDQVGVIPKLDQVLDCKKFLINKNDNDLDDFLSDLELLEKAPLIKNKINVSTLIPTPTVSTRDPESLDDPDFESLLEDSEQDPRADAPENTDATEDINTKLENAKMELELGFAMRTEGHLFLGNKSFQNILTLEIDNYAFIDTSRSNFPSLLLVIEKGTNILYTIALFKDIKKSFVLQYCYLTSVNPRHLHGKPLKLFTDLNNHTFAVVGPHSFCKIFRFKNYLQFEYLTTIKFCDVVDIFFKQIGTDATNCITEIILINKKGKILLIQYDYKLDKIIKRQTSYIGIQDKNDIIRSVFSLSKEVLFLLGKENQYVAHKSNILNTEPAEIKQFKPFHNKEIKLFELPCLISEIKEICPTIRYTHSVLYYTSSSNDMGIMFSDSSDILETIFIKFSLSVEAENAPFIPMCCFPSELQDEVILRAFLYKGFIDIPIRLSDEMIKTLEEPSISFSIVSLPWEIHEYWEPQICLGTSVVSSWPINHSSIFVEYRDRFRTLNLFGSNLMARRSLNIDYLTKFDTILLYYWDDMGDSVSSLIFSENERKDDSCMLVASNKKETLCQLLTANDHDIDVTFLDDIIPCASTTCRAILFFHDLVLQISATSVYVNNLSSEGGTTTRKVFTSDHQIVKFTMLDGTCLSYCSNDTLYVSESIVDVLDEKDEFYETALLKALICLDTDAPKIDSERGSSSHNSSQTNDNHSNSIVTISNGTNLYSVKNRDYLKDNSYLIDIELISLNDINDNTMILLICTTVSRMLVFDWSKVVDFLRVKECKLEKLHGIYEEAVLYNWKATGISSSSISDGKVTVVANSGIYMLDLLSIVHDVNKSNTAKKLAVKFGKDVINQRNSWKLTLKQTIGDKQLFFYDKSIYMCDMKDYEKPEGIEIPAKKFQFDLYQSKQVYDAIFDKVSNSILAIVDGGLLVLKDIYETKIVHEIGTDVHAAPSSNFNGLQFLFGDGRNYIREDGYGSLRFAGGNDVGTSDFDASDVAYALRSERFDAYQIFDTNPSSPLGLLCVWNGIICLTRLVPGKPDYILSVLDTYDLYSEEVWFHFSSMKNKFVATYSNQCDSPAVPFEIVGDRLVRKHLSDVSKSNVFCDTGILGEYGIQEVDGALYVLGGGSPANWAPFLCSKECRPIVLNNDTVVVKWDARTLRFLEITREQATAPTDRMSEARERMQEYLREASNEDEWFDLEEMLNVGDPHNDISLSASLLPHRIEIDEDIVSLQYDQFTDRILVYTTYKIWVITRDPRMDLPRPHSIAIRNYIPSDNAQTKFIARRIEQ